MPDSLDFDTIFATLDGLKAQFGKRFIIGLSGGGDSMALTHLCARWAEGKDVVVTALCIDHGFRPASNSEAQQAADWARALGIEADVWTNCRAAPKTGLQEFARGYRHDVFGQAAYEAGGATILLGHTRDDQAETIAFRIARKTGLDGLAGIAPISHGLAVWQGQSFPLARPLLDTSRASLRDFLVQNSHSWIDDPSNEDKHYSRVKVRHRLARLGQSERLVRIGKLARVLREALDVQADQLEQRCAKDGGLAATLFLDAYDAVQSRLLHKMLVKAGAPNRPIHGEKMSNLLRQMHHFNFAGATLAGVKVTRTNQIFRFQLAPMRSVTKSNQPKE
jgi:tRNA(Ile)-lysidine synthase